MLSDSGLCVGFEIDGTRVALSRPESLLLGKISQDDSIVSRMADLKRVGLARMFALMAEDKEPWPLAQGLDDSKVDQVGDHSRTWPEQAPTSERLKDSWRSSS
jgi:hypothetical protein